MGSRSASRSPNAASWAPRCSRRLATNSCTVAHFPTGPRSELRSRAAGRGRQADAGLPGAAEQPHVLVRHLDPSRSSRRTPSCRLRQSWGSPGTLRAKQPRQPRSRTPHKAPRWTADLRTKAPRNPHGAKARTDAVTRKNISHSPKNTQTRFRKRARSVCSLPSRRSDSRAEAFDDLQWATATLPWPIVCFRGCGGFSQPSPPNATPGSICVIIYSGRWRNAQPCGSVGDSTKEDWDEDNARRLGPASICLCLRS